MKIALITLGPHYNIGGVEKYNWHLIEMLKIFGHQVVEICTQPKNETICRPKVIESMYMYNRFLEKNFIFKILKVIYTKIVLKKLLKKLIKQKFDLFIFSSPYVFKNKKILKKSIFIQHFPINKYLTIGIKLFFGNPLKNHKNFVLYTKYDELILKKIRKNCNANIVNIPLFGFDKNLLENIKYKNPMNNENITYIGRFDNRSKNLKFMEQVANYIKSPIHIYGYGDFIPKSNYILVHDWINEEEALNIIRNSKIVISVSNYEGFSFMISQAISLGVPFISRNCSASINFLSNNKINGIIVEISKSPDEYGEILKKNLKNYNFNYLEILDFYNKNMSHQNFIKNWKNFIDSFYKN